VRFVVVGDGWEGSVPRFPPVVEGWFSPPDSAYSKGSEGVKPPRESVAVP